MIALVIAAFAATAFVVASLLGSFGSWLPARGRAYAVAAAAGILLVIAFGDLYPEALGVAGQAGVAGFIAGFALLFVAEALTHAHTHHAPGEGVHAHALGPFVLGLAIHNLADGFALGVAAASPDAATGLLGVGVLVHQVPVGLSLAAVFAAGRIPRAAIVRLTLPLGLAIPGAALATVAAPVPSGTVRGVVLGVAGGVLTYLATTHLLPEAQGEGGGRLVTLVFLVTLVLMTLALFTVLGE